MLAEIIVLILAYIIDRIIGDPESFPHPIRWIGWMTTKGEEILRPIIRDEKIAGSLLAVIIIVLTYAVFDLIDILFYDHNHSSFIAFLLFLVMLYFTYAMLATGELIRSALRVIAAVESGDIDEAREKLGMIVGRDTAALESDDIKKAVIETVSENASDGIIAPLFYFAIGGLPLAMAYKAVNTLDSMIGYRNEKYREFGWASARLDDIANYIPARITGLFIVVAAITLDILTGLDRVNNLSGSRAFRIMRTDGRNHPSPNSGIPEAAMAGALGVRLGGPSGYGGIIMDKPWIGEELLKTEMRYSRASQGSVAIVKIVSLFGLCGAIVILLFRNMG